MRRPNFKLPCLRNNTRPLQLSSPIVLSITANSNTGHHCCGCYCCLMIVLCLQEALKSEKARLQAALAEEERHAKATQQSSGNQAEQQSGEGGDELDAFMGQVAVQLEQDKVTLQPTLSTGCQKWNLLLKIAVDRQPD